MPDSPYWPIYTLTRGETVESIHYGAIAVVDAAGRLVAQYGDPQAVTFLRSTAKPFQAMPFVEQEGRQAFEMTDAEIALMCASHAGTDAHVETARSIQAKAGISEDDLQCGVHPPYHPPTRQAMAERGEQPTPNRHNCSGKHSGMLSLARLNDWPTDTYLSPDNPVQQAILHTFAEMCELSPDEIALGTDGCSAPNFAVPLFNVALAYARLCNPSRLSHRRAEACRAITCAMTGNPEMVHGPGGFDTLLMEVGAGNIVSKGGAEGYQGIGLMADSTLPGSPALGIAIKIADGDARRQVRAAVALEVLRQLNALSGSDLESLKQFGPVRPIHNWRKLEVGEARPAFILQRN